MKKLDAALYLSVACSLLVAWAVTAKPVTDASSTNTLNSAKHFADTQSQLITKKVTLPGVLPDKAEYSMKVEVHLADASRSDSGFSSTMVSPDGQPALAQVGSETSYVSGAVKHLDHKWSYKQSKVWQGVKVMLTPYAANDGKIDVNYAIATAKLLSMRSFKQGDASIQAPEVAKNSASGNVELINGKPLTLHVPGKYTVTFEVNRT